MYNDKKIESQMLDRRKKIRVISLVPDEIRETSPDKAFNDSSMLPLRKKVLDCRLLFDRVEGGEKIKEGCGFSGVSK